MQLISITGFCLLAATITSALPGAQKMTLVRYWWGNTCPGFLASCPNDHATCPKPKNEEGKEIATFLSKDELKAHTCKEISNGDGYGIFHIPDWFQGTDYRDSFTRCKITFYDQKHCKGNVVKEYTEWHNRKCLQMNDSLSVKTDCSAAKNHKTGGKTDTGPSEGHDGIGEDDDDEQ
ncbi:hypothetical protein AC578_9124 [Pseudocercospora eumusae]|uniref:Secreted protein n=1 Tax=Pseudocercospora eumusae TaxID=321146 RepID=A0A139HV95_9PEZI|nr:hypothetical protein AC578_9124 [Pseudocercospora eumusae]